MEFKQRKEPMPILIEHPDIPSANPSILKRRNKEKELSPASTKTVNFIRHPDTQSNGYCPTRSESTERPSTHGRTTHKTA